MQVGREDLRWIESASCNILPGLGGHDLRVDFLLPENFERLALGVVVEA